MLFVLDKTVFFFCLWDMWQIPIRATVKGVRFDLLLIESFAHTVGGRFEVRFSFPGMVVVGVGLLEATI